MYLRSRGLPTYVWRRRNPSKKPPSLVYSLRSITAETSGLYLVSEICFLLLCFRSQSILLTLIRADDDESPLFRVNAEELVCMSMSPVVTLVIIVDLV